MAVLKTILHMKNSSGSYDDVYLRTRVDNILLTDNSTLLSTKLSTMDTAIANKAASSHTHSEYAASNHTHPASQITGLTTGARIATGSYTGNGSEYGGGSKTKSITCGFTPKFVMVYTGTGLQPSSSGEYWIESFIWTTGVTTQQISYYYSDRDRSSVLSAMTATSTGLQWSASSSTVAFNISNKTYYWLAIG